MTKTVWEDELALKSYEVDCTGRLKLSALFNYFQETAGNHATHLGVGYEVLRKLGYFWVLSRAKVHINRLPAWGETVSLLTWPKGQDGLLFVRDFRMMSNNNGTLLTGSTGWLLLDIEHNKPHFAEVLPVVLPANEHGHAIEEPLRKLKPVQDGVLKYERKVMVSDLDVNYHVNNARYIDWIMDCLDLQQVTSQSVRTLQVNYVGEAFLGDVVGLLSREAQDGRHSIEGVNSSKGSKVIQACIEWK
jgi:medium-chain acyl-[acyl-carrier-protein] hydrolase